MNSDPESLDDMIRRLDAEIEHHVSFLSSLKTDREKLVKMRDAAAEFGLVFTRKEQRS